jgi:ADP-ribose pyrophosphatase
MKQYKNKIPDNATLAYKGKVFEVYQWPQRLFDGSTETFEMVKRQDTVIVIAVVDDKIVIVHDEQPQRSPKLCLPGGRVDDDAEPWLTAAQREMREETGYRFAQWRLIRKIEDQPKMQHAVLYYVAYDVIDQIEQKLDAGERIEVQLRSLEEVKQLAEDPDTYIKYAKEIFDRAQTIDDVKSSPYIER